MQIASESTFVTGNGCRTYISIRYEKKICTKFWFLVVDFQPDPLRPFGDFENPLGQHAVPSGLRSGLRSALRASLRPPVGPSGPAGCPRGFLKSPPDSGDLGENPLNKIRIFYTNSS